MHKRPFSKKHNKNGQGLDGIGPMIRLVVTSSEAKGWTMPARKDVARNPSPITLNIHGEFKTDENQPFN
jgi:hypothetical protein